MPPRFPVHAFTKEAPLTTITRSVKEMWPFVLGFSCTGYIFVKIAGSVTGEQQSFWNLGAAARPP
ncbi:hypothetical protein CHLNCDRAFT_135733 [Chlorella variabilis]|uniref:Uncharacterized protein n=1 Tax=Chlorella variabilis TaxID=554065 RepID=E1ZIW1_CHLVA|nr:hypothetical protein CHLNCDRAFT_135733 [Chlorella variabilis]EFN54227.1 hypothetical protein CHLNCDRAFT_135733 [Chlorella variabilis]|eukprot:XP_005846329.1 hypothetical protein CHLNCDRAFT_135733 [Chlorella variabilis]